MTTPCDTRQPELIADVLIRDDHDHRPTGVRIAQDGLIHRLSRYNARRAVWEFYCEGTFHGDARHEYASFERATCVACFARTPWFRR